MRVYPNPVSEGETLVMELSQALSPAAMLSVYDVSGRMIHRLQASDLQSMDGRTYSLSLPGGVSSGTYVLEVIVGSTNVNHLLRVK